jgi:hypothetical protein
LTSGCGRLPQDAVDYRAFRSDVLGGESRGKRLQPINRERRPCSTRPGLLFPL